MADTCAAARVQLLERARGAHIAEATAHLTTCEPCQAFARTLANAIAGERALMAQPADAEMLERVRVKLRPVIAETAERRRRQAWGLWPWVAGLGFATAIALVLGFVVLRARHVAPPIDAVALIADGVSSGDTPGSATALQRNARVLPGEVLDISGNLLVALGPQRLVGAATTRLRFLSTRPSDVAVELTRGRIVAQVEPVDGQAPKFSVMWPDGELVVTGTIFQVISNVDATEVAVARGHVRVRARDSGSWLDVAAGSAVSLQHGSAVWRTLPDAERVAMLDATVPRSAPAAPAETPAPAALVLDDGAPERVPNKARTPVQAHREPLSGPPLSVEDVARGGDCEAAAQTHDARTVPAAARARGFVAVGDCFRGRGDVDSALAWYERAARESDGTPASENAAYELGRMLTERGRIAEADKAFAAYLQRYPSGTFASDANLARCSLAVQQERADDALTCLRDYRERYPQSPRLRDTFLLEATVLRVSKNDCAGAVRAYDAYLANPGTYAREAKSWKAWCERHGTLE